MKQDLGGVTSVMAVTGLAAAGIGAGILLSKVLRELVQWAFTEFGSAVGMGVVLLLVGVGAFGVAYVIEFVAWGE